jgi:DNA topoisomerase-2
LWFLLLFFVKLTGVSSLPNKDYFGVFPMRGLIPNAQTSPCKQLDNNDEIQCLTMLLGIDKYESFESLKYHKVLIMADQV